ncbi:hypothetical protein A3K69_08270 [Candidatus Bathyarchaeota archaeon RBG_16_57_9]|nr:MAG: hypothetical protein A3K69_08270 [Candidatus Bathyarchaeota archaeon RBG_16_57_9]
MYAWGEVKLTEEEVDEILHKTAEKIQLYGMETVAILTLESVKPMVYIGGELSRVVLAPFLPALGPQYDALGDKLITIFEDRKNIEKLIQILEKMTKGEYTPRGKDAKPPEKAKEEAAAEPKEDAEPKKDEADDGSERRGWRRWLPF